MASDEKSLICDPFSGSATIGIAANLLGRKFVGFEKEDKFITISINRKIELEKNFTLIQNKIKDLKILRK